MSSHPPPASERPIPWRHVGPGLVVAATGVGAGDLVAAAKTGATFGGTLLWTAIVGAVLKYVLAEGVGRWQLATGTTLLQGWMLHFGRPVRWLFRIYLLLWTVIVAAALMAACGLATHALVPRFGVRESAIVHAVAALVFVRFERYAVFESVMKWVVGLMVVALVGCAFAERPEPGPLLRGLTVPSVPRGGLVLALGVLGGVGGTLTLLSYNYWMREKGWQGPAWRGVMRVDLGVGYGLTGLFGVAVMVLAATVLHPQGVEISGNRGVLHMAALLGDTLGRPGEILFLLGFWGAVASSLLGVWQSVPWMAVEAFGHPAARAAPAAGRRPPRLYHAYVAGMTFVPMLLLLVDRPVWLVVAYAAFGSLFMPFLAVTLLLLNNRSAELGDLRNGTGANVGLVVCVLLFVALAVREFVTRWAS